MSKNSSSCSTRVGLTLIEVLAALALLSTLLVGMLVAHPIYTAIVARQVLDDQAVLAIREAALTHSPGSGVAFAIIDERPDDTAWLQIATLRARGFSLVLLTQTLLQDGRASQKERRLLHNHLDRILGRGHNPYDVRSPVYDVLKSLDHPIT